MLLRSFQRTPRTLWLTSLVPRIASVQFARILIVTSLSNLHTPYPPFSLFPMFRIRIHVHDCTYRNSLFVFWRHPGVPPKALSFSTMLAETGEKTVRYTLSLFFVFSLLYLCLSYHPLFLERARSSTLAKSHPPRPLAFLPLLWSLCLRSSWSIYLTRILYIFTVRTWFMYICMYNSVYGNQYRYSLSLYLFLSLCLCRSLIL